MRKVGCQVRVTKRKVRSVIDPANVDRVFGALFTTKPRGMGMGLSICQSIIESHKGRIWVAAGSLRGTTLHFEVPTKAAGETKAGRPWSRPPNPSAATATNRRL